MTDLPSGSIDSLLDVSVEYSLCQDIVSSKLIWIGKPIRL
jgi:hypothetical protein